MNYQNFRNKFRSRASDDPLSDSVSWHAVTRLLAIHARLTLSCRQTLLFVVHLYAITSQCYILNYWVQFSKGCFGRLNFLLRRIEKWLSSILINVSLRLYKKKGNLYFFSQQYRIALPVTTNVRLLSFRFTNKCIFGRVGRAGFC